jgi:predicted Zn finger-like uncharacterized protein
MYLTCPSCDSRFQVAIEQLGPKGRRVRCGRCGHDWRALAEREAPPEAESDAESPAAEAASPEPARTAGDSAPAAPTSKLEAFDEARRRSRAERPRTPSDEPKRRGGAAGWFLFLVVVVALAAGAVLGRQQVVAWVPATAELYALAGLSVESPLEILDASSELRELDGEESLLVVGRIVNPTDAPQPVPPITATILGPDGARLRQWTFAADLDLLPPGGSTDFETSTAVPPAQSRLNLDFSSAP